MLFPFCLSLPSAPPADREVSLKLTDFFLEISINNEYAY